MELLILTLIVFSPALVIFAWGMMAGIAFALIDSDGKMTEWWNAARRVDRNHAILLWPYVVYLRFKKQ
jgi:hypothetical protein